MQCVVSKFVPRLLSVNQKQQQLYVCLDLKENAANDPCFLSNVITGDETWVYAYDPETKTQSSQWKSLGSPQPKKARQVRSKSMWIYFFDQKGIVHKEFVPPGQTVNAAFYVEVLKRLWENVRRKRPDQWQNNKWLLHHDNVPAHAPSWLDGFWPITTWLWCHILSTRPTLHPATFSLFPKLKMKLKGWRFQTLEEIQTELQAVLDTLWENDFQECLKNWQRCWHCCQASEWDYFEGDASP